MPTTIKLRKNIQKITGKQILHSPRAKTLEKIKQLISEYPEVKYF